MEGSYPVMIDGELAGKLTVRKKGAQTEFCVECRPLPGIVRISVYGGGREAYLGVLAPEGDKLTLRKLLSRAAMLDFPEQIESAERAGRPTAPAAAEVQTTAEEAAETPAVPEAMAPPPAESDTVGVEELRCWYASPDGALVRFDGERNLIALPLGDPRIPAGDGGVPQFVEGREYLVFRTKHGRLLRE